MITRCFHIVGLIALLLVLAAVPLSAQSAGETETDPFQPPDAIIDGAADVQTSGDTPIIEESFPQLALPLHISAEDKPYDSGNRIIISWELPAEVETGELSGYNIYRAEEDVPAAYEKLNKQRLSKRTTEFEDRQEFKLGGHKLKNNTTYYYKLSAVSADDAEIFSTAVTAKAEMTIFNDRKINSLFFVLLYIGILLYSIAAARSGRSTYIRRLAGVDAIEEAVGRATEMGKPVMYLCGLSDLSDVSTIAAINILGGVARKVANYQSRLILPCRDPMVMTVAQEVVKEAYLTEGRPDAYREEDIYYTTYDQFPYVASVDGIMLREKPATNLYMGYYYAESLILAETGASAGAIQIAGTDAVTQLPFFVTACDYTLMGEELYAASAYISENPLLIGSLKGQDYMKFVLGCIIIAGIAMVTLISIFPSLAFFQSIINLLQPLTSG